MALKGIPNSLRGEAWRRLVRSDELQAAHPQGTYQALLQKESLYRDQVNKDVPRTWPHHSLYHDRDGPGQQSLMNVLTAYSVYNPSVGYCGGMATLPGIFLMYMSEEEAFWLFVRLCIDYGMEHQYAYCNALGINRSVYILERLLPVFLPDLSRHMAHEGVDVRLYASRWLITNFAADLPFTAAVRFLDAFMVDGYDSALIMCITLLSVLSDKLIEMDFDQIIYFFNQLKRGEHLNVRKLMKRYAKMSVRLRSKINKFSAQLRVQLQREGADVAKANRIPRM